ncbi:sulfotransferase [Nocardioides bruguierae]|uniref:Sulfotransferase n=1 Tax=Nocardioides bruguierae TaxID=2945102 RepID=A0A9X2D601_9ACTN|nr:sulfotransferase [Nocardioides bruguierae]MCM0619946.1 sulfotransferase [Nocardioides bruguierae]
MSAQTTPETSPSGAADPGPAGPPVLYLAGIGRSGTTLLERVLGAVPGVVALGETMHLWERGLERGERCGCGEPFTACEFWAAVGEDAFGGWEHVDTARMAALKQRVDRASRVPALAAGAMADDVREYAAAYRAVHAAAARVSGARVVVDSSKQVSLAWALALGGADVRLVHCLRDARGVAHSWAQEVARPEAVDAAHGEMPRYSAATVSALWLLHNVEIEALGCRVPSMRLRYEDFVADPRTTTREVLSLVGLAHAPLPHVTHDALELGVTHSCAGNPMRYTHGSVPVRRDERWRTGQPVAQRRAVTALTWPLLRRYSYSTSYGQAASTR